MTNTIPTWWLDATVYHIYPLGYCGAPAVNEFAGEPTPRLRVITDRLDEIGDMGFTALYLGPVFESSGHGYDTADYRRVDRRLGTNGDLADLVRQAHRRGMRVLLDGVFNHVGRDFWAFRDVRERGAASPYSGWFRGVDFASDNGYGDGFAYEGWEGDLALVSLNHRNPELSTHLLGSVREMISRYDIDGLRLDVAYLLPRDFIEALRTTVDSAKEEFVLLGEVIHGDYASYLSPGGLDSVTNYQMYKALWSAHNDRNYFELAHTLARQADTMNGALASLCSFVDNHDVDRIVSVLHEPQHRYAVYALLFTLPGVPAVYYGSEWGHAGRKADGDSSLRPAVWEVEPRDPSLNRFIRELATSRAASPTLRYGGYEAVHIAAAQWVFLRAYGGRRVLVAVNADGEPTRVGTIGGGLLTTGRCLFTGERVDLRAEGEGGGLSIPAYGARIIELDGAS